MNTLLKVQLPQKLQLCPKRKMLCKYYVIHPETKEDVCLRIPDWPFEANYCRYKPIPHFSEL